MEDALGTADVGEIVATAAVVAVAAFAVGFVVTLLLRRLAERWGVSVAWVRAERSPIVALFVVVSVRVVMVQVGERADSAVSLLDVALIGIVGWIFLVIARVAEKGLLKRFPDTSLESRHSRHARTKIALLRRIADAVIVTLVVAAVLWTIPAVREIGVGLFASAGVVGIVFGLAAQTSLSNLFAGVQIAFTDGIRIDDIVDIEGRWGRIEDITLTYVVVRVWDGTSLILPCTYFTTTPFLNWTHEGTSTTGTVELGVDWEVPVAEIRAELRRVLSRSTHWDGRKGELHVEDASGPIVTLVAEVSAPDGDALAPLRREVREGLVRFIQVERSDAVPREHEESVTRLLPPDPATLDAYRSLGAGAAGSSASGREHGTPEGEG